MKKQTLFVATTTLAMASLSTYAATPASAAPFQVIVPDLNSGLILNLQGLYLNSNMAYNDLSTIGNDDVSNVQSSADKHKYDLGFGVGLGYIFPHSGNDVQINWTHFEQTNNAAISYQSNFGTQNITKTREGSFKYDAVDLDVGQYINIGTRSETRLFAGVRGVQLKLDVANVQKFAGASSSIYEPDTANMKFTGVGPRVGVDTIYHVSNGFGLVGHFAAALLVGQTESSGIASVTFNPSGVTFAHLVNVDKQTRVVPAFDGKLGVNYMFSFKNQASHMNIEAGYQVTQYLNVFDNLSGVDQISDSLKNTNVSFNGPYLSLSFKI